MANRPDPILTTLAELVQWCKAAPEGTLIPVSALAEVLDRVSGGDHKAKTPYVRTPSSEQPEALPAMTWKERIWLVPPETRLTVPEVAEALARPKSFVYARTYEGAEDPIPHRRIGRNLRFVACEIREWITEAEGGLPR